MLCSCAHAQSTWTLLCITLMASLVCEALLNTVRYLDYLRLFPVAHGCYGLRATSWSPGIKVPSPVTCGQAKTLPEDWCPATSKWTWEQVYHGFWDHHVLSAGWINSSLATGKTTDISSPQRPSASLRTKTPGTGQPKLGNLGVI